MRTEALLSPIAGYRWPRLAGPVDTEKINRALAKGVLLFEDSPPVVLNLTKRDGTPYKSVSSTGYVAVRTFEFRTDSQGKNHFDLVYKLGRNPKYRAAYLACCEEAGEEPRVQAYTVDPRRQVCDCVSFFDNTNFCKHVLGMAWMLTRPHYHTTSGLLVVIKEQVYDPTDPSDDD